MNLKNFPEDVMEKNGEYLFELIGFLSGDKLNYKKIESHTKRT